MRKLLLSVGCAVLVAACDLPTSPTLVRLPASTPLPPPVASPLPANVFGEPFTALTPGATVRRVVSSAAGGADNPHCPDLPGWGCQFFRVTSDVRGRLDVTLTWVLETQPNQGLDLSLDRDRGGAIWSDRGPGSSQVLSVGIDAGEMYQLVVWYTFPGLEFELRTSFSPS